MQSTTIPVKDISPAMFTSMLGLMQGYYENVDPAQFEADLKKKDLVIMLLSGKELQGFSTQVLHEYKFAGRKNHIVYSGDTIIHSQHRNSLALPVAFGKLLLTIHEKDRETPLYWLLTSKGYKTYRFLPVFFKHYYPNFRTTPLAAEKKLIEEFCQNLFREKFDLEKGIVKAGVNGQILNFKDSKINAQRRKNPDIAYFEKRNPGYLRGDELVCFTRFHTENLTTYILKQLAK